MYWTDDQEHLTEEEQSIKRGRNQSVSPAKNHRLQTTGFEALLGYLSEKRWKRMLELVKIGLDSIKE